MGESVIFPVMHAKGAGTLRIPFKETRLCHVCKGREYWEADVSQWKHQCLWGARRWKFQPIPSPPF